MYRRSPVPSIRHRLSPIARHLLERTGAIRRLSGDVCSTRLGRTASRSNFVDADPALDTRSKAMRSALRALLADSRGAAAVEFAIVGSTFIAVLVIALFLLLMMFLNQSLDYATAKAARQIMTGAVQTGALTQSAFRTNVVCAYLPAAFKCSDVIVNVQTVAEASQPGGYYALVNAGQTGLIIPPLSNASTQFNLGVQGSYVYLQVMYPLTQLPAVFVNIFSPNVTYNGSSAYVLVSTMAFRNEQY